MEKCIKGLHEKNPSGMTSQNKQLVRKGSPIEMLPRPYTSFDRGKGPHHGWVRVACCHGDINPSQHAGYSAP